jgi:predicted membrane protein
MERFFQILAVILGGVAAYFLWQGNADYTFAAVVFAAVSFFISMRFQIRERLDRHEAERLAEEEKWRVEEEDFEVEELEDWENPVLNEVPAKEQFGGEQRTTDKEQV